MKKIYDITSDGTTSIGVQPAEYIIHVAGNFGGGTFDVKWNDGVNTETYPDGSFTSAGGFIVGCGVGNIDLTLTGATNPVIRSTVTRLTYPAH